MADAIKRWTPIEDEEGLGFVGMFSADNGRYVLHSDHLAALKAATNLTRDQQVLNKFYNVETKDALIAEQAHHIVKLQGKLAAFDTQVAIRKAREG